jgi:hypothetical protein
MENQEDIDNNLEDEGDVLPEYSDDEDYKKVMNEAIMRKIDEDTNKYCKIKKKPIKIACNEMAWNTITENKKQKQNITLGEFVKAVDKKLQDKPGVFVSKRKQDKIGALPVKRQFNPRLPPYMMTVKKKTSMGDVDLETNFPSL